MIDFLRITPLVLSFFINIIMLIGLIGGSVKTIHLKTGQKVKNSAIVFAIYVLMNIWCAYYGLKALVHIGFSQ